MKVQSWEVSEKFWQHVGFLIPACAGRPSTQVFARKPKEARVVFETIVYMLRTGLIVPGVEVPRGAV